MTSEPARDDLAPPVDRAPAVDVSVLDALVAQLDPDDSGLRDVLLTSYLDDSSAQVARLLTAAADADLAAAASVAHTLRSTSALLGARHLAELLLGAEGAIRDGSGLVPAVVHEIDAEHLLVARAFQDLRRTTAVAAPR